MPLIEGDTALPDNARHNAGIGDAGPDSANTAATAFGDAVNFLTHFSRRQESIAPAVHGRAAGVGGLPVEGNGVALHAESSQHST